MSKIEPVSIDGIEFDALIESDETLASDIPQYPVESGYEVSDTIILKPRTLEITVFVTNTPVTHLQRFGGAENCRARVDDVIARLESMRAQRKLVTIVTTNRTYKNMGLENMSIRNSIETGYSRKIPLSFKEVFITSTQTVSIPESYGKSGTTGASAGTAQTSTSDSSSGSSSGSSNTTALKTTIQSVVGSGNYNAFMNITE